ncbi:MAG: XRE family transcriptional regulator [Caulobacteraceae bacterium]|nr:XRE family transcriptional regulator [Caulobacteraceae bacterium]
MGGASAKPVSIALRAKAFDTVARQPGPMRALIETYGDALERSRRTGEAVRFVVAVEPRGIPNITPLEPAAPKPEIAGTDDLDRALGAARARGRTRVAEILSGEDMFSAERFADLIGTSRVTVNTKRKNNQVLGLEGAKRGYRFPEWQISHDGKPFAALPELFERLGDGPWAVYRFLVQRHPELNGLTGRDALRRGKAAQALEVAESISRGTFA